MEKNPLYIKSKLEQCVFTRPKKLDIVSAKCSFSLKKNKDDHKKIMINGVCFLKNSSDESEINESEDEGIFLSIELNSFFEKKDGSFDENTQEDTKYYTRICFNEIKLFISQLTSSAFNTPIFIPDLQEGQYEDEEDND